MRATPCARLLAALAVIGGLASAGADEGQAKVETTVLVRINQAEHEGVDGSSLHVAPRSAHVAWRASGEGGSWWTVDGKKGKAFAHLGDLVFSEDGEHHAYLAHTPEAQFVVVDGQERPMAAGRGITALRLAPNGTSHAFIENRPEPDGEPNQAVWVDGKEGPRFARINEKTLVISGDGKRHAYVALVSSKEGGSEVVIVDGKATKPYTAGTVGAPRFSADGTRYGYEVKKPEARVVVDGVEGPVFDRAMSLAFAPKGARYFHVAVRGGKPVLVVDGKEEPALVDIMAPGPVWSADGAHLAYVAMKVVDQKAVRRVVLDGVDGPVFARIGAESLLLSPDGKRHAYWAGNGPKPFYVVDGVAQKEADLVGKHAAFSPDSKRFAYSVQRGGKWFVVTDGVEGPPVDGIKVGFPVFTSDGAHVVYEADLAGASHVFVDGKPGPALEAFAEDGFALGQGSSSVGVIARRGDGWRLVVDGVESAEEFQAVLPGSVLAADGPRSFRVWVARGGELLLLRATVTPAAGPR